MAIMGHAGHAFTGIQLMAVKLYALGVRLLYLVRI
jgi:hypothetical protein